MDCAARQLLECTLRCLASSSSNSRLWVRVARQRWYLSMFGERITDPQLWSLNRHSITGGVRRRHRDQLHPAAGAHDRGGARGAVLALQSAGGAGQRPRWSIRSRWCPFYYGAYRLGACVLRCPAAPFRVSSQLALARARPRARSGSRSCSAAWCAPWSSACSAAWHWSWSWRMATMRRYRAAPAAAPRSGRRRTG